MKALDAGDATTAGRKMQQMLTAMHDVEQFHQIEGHAHVRHFLGDARGLLRQMVRLVNVREQLLGTLAAVGDLSYAFDVISDYVPLMHALIKKDPFAVLCRTCMHKKHPVAMLLLHTHAHSSRMHTHRCCCCGRPLSSLPPCSNCPSSASIRPGRLL